VRCFVAIDLPAEVRDAVAEAQRGLRAAVAPAAVSWGDPGTFHLTLRFLGEVAEATVARVSAALDAVCAGRAPLALEAAGLGGFPTASRPRVIWAGVPGGAPELPALAAAVEGAMAPLGFPAEARPFRAHVTIGRVRTPRPAPALAAALAAAARMPFGRWTAAEVVLYRSQLRPSGAVHSVLGRHRLGAVRT
jgi:RNA 2',3'-cyclic 3'-phosphodiesterase